MAHQRTKTLPGATNRSSIFFTASHDKRNMLWKAFRKTVLEPHSIHILENAATEKVPEALLELIEEMCQNLDRHEKQASSFREAVAQGRGFGPSPIFPPDIVPPVNDQVGLARCMEPSFDKKTLPPHEISLHMPLFELPIPRPGLACGFSTKAFSEKELRNLPEWITAVGTYSDYDTGQIQPGQAVHVPFLMFERTYGHARHEIEAAMNYCAMDGAAALNALALLFDKAWPQDDWSRPSNPAVFSCTVDDDVGIIHHHWIDEHKAFMAAPLCKFDLRDAEHFMHFLAWIEAIEQWAAYFLLPDIKEALSIVGGTTVAKTLLTPITTDEKNEKLKRSMKLAFDNIPWRNERIQGAPLAVTAAMRVRSPRTEEKAVSNGSAASPSELMKWQNSEIFTTNSHKHAGSAALPTSARTAPESYPHPSPVLSFHSTGAATTDSSRDNVLPSPLTAGNSLERSGSPKRSNIDMLPPSRSENLLQSNTTPAMSSPAFSTSAVSETPPRADNMVGSKTSAMSSPACSTGSNIPRSYTPAVQSPPMSANSIETTPTTHVHHNIPRSKYLGTQQQNPIPSALATTTYFPSAHKQISKTTPSIVKRYGTPVPLSNTTTTATGKDSKVSTVTHATLPQKSIPPPIPLPQALLTPPYSSTSTSTSTVSSPPTSSVHHKRSLSSLRQPKRIRSPATPESTSTSTSPRIPSSSTFRSKLSTSLGMIKEHALSRPKRARTDNSGPPTPKPGDGPLLTPAYDKRRFQTPDEMSGPGQTSAWVEHVLHDRVLVGGEGANGSTAGSVGVRTPGTAGTGIGTATATSPPPRKQTVTPVKSPVQTVIQASQSLTQAVIPSAGSSNYLPLRNYGGVSEGTKAVTVTAGAV